MVEELMDAVADRRRGVLPSSSAWLDEVPGLAEEVAAWPERLEPVRASIPARVEELLGGGDPLGRLPRLAGVAAVAAAQVNALAVLDLPRSALLRRPLGPAAARRMRRAFQQLGPAYIKLGQLISSGRGLFPDVLVDEFAACRDRCPPVPWSRARRVLEAELGPLTSVFASIDETPMAAASIAQVHRATLLDGRPVVAKVRRPGIRREVEGHTRSMPLVAGVLQRLFPEVEAADPMAVVRLYASTILEELDLRLEAQNLVDVALDLEAAQITDVVVPHPVPGLVTRRVLVMEELAGSRFDDLEQMRAAGIDTTALLLSGLRALLEGALVFGRFHGDLHAGNVVALPDGRFGLVDFGICARLDERGRAGLRSVLFGVLAGDTVAQVHGLDVLGALPAHVERRRFAALLAAARAEAAAAMSIDDLRDGTPRFMRVFADHKLNLPPGLALFLKDMLYLNGSTRLLAPDLDVVSLAAGLQAYFGGKYGDGDPLAADGAGSPLGGPLTEDELAAGRAELRRRMAPSP